MTSKKEKEVRKILLQAIESGRPALSEYESKKVIATSGVLVTREALVGIGNLGMNHKEIAEIDINPLIVKKGRPVAVDALVLLKT